MSVDVSVPGGSVPQVVFLVEKMVFFVLLPLVILAWLWIPVSAIWVWENSRFVSRQLNRKRPIRKREHRTMLIVPVKGVDDDLRCNLEGFFHQDHPNYELVFAVESCHDPAVAVINRLVQENPGRNVRLVVAGVAKDTGQKVHNLLEATREIPEDVRVLAFADADIQPDSRWLHTLIYPVVSSRKRVAVTGYRMIVPSRLSWPNLLVTSANNAILGAMGAGGHYPIWGGSWAMRRDSFERLNIRRAWKGTISDDLVATRVLRSQSAKIVFEPRAVSASRWDASWKGAWEFLCRQSVIARWYTPGLFWSVAFLLVVNLVAMGTAAVSLAVGGPLAMGAATATLAAIWGGSLYRGVLRTGVVRRYARRTGPVSAVALLYEIFCWPVTLLACAWVLIAAVFKRSICWRGNVYRVDSRGQLSGPDMTRCSPAGEVGNGIWCSEAHEASTDDTSRAA